MEAATVNGNGSGAPREMPSTQLRNNLQRCRNAGMRFDQAWARSIRAIRWPHDTRQREDWRAALRGTREEWRACYYGEMTPAAERMRDFEVASFVPAVPDLDGLPAAAAL
jgi:hypothetical protein